MLTFSHPGSRGQKGTQSRIPDPDPQHCVPVLIVPTSIVADPWHFDADPDPQQGTQPTTENYR